MARSSLRIPSAKTVALAVLATSMLVALFSKRGSVPQEKPRNLASSTGAEEMEEMVILQGRLHTDLGDLSDNASSISSDEEQIETLSKDTAPLNPSRPQLNPSCASLVVMRIRESAAGLRESLRHLAERAGIKRVIYHSTGTGITIVMFITLGILLCCLISFMRWSLKCGQTNDAQGDIMSPSSQRLTPRSPPPNFSRPGTPVPSSWKGIADGLSQPGTTMTLNGVSAFETKEMPPTSGSFLPDPGAMNSGTSAVQVPLPCTTITDLQRPSVRFPPLCPSLMMPWSEALLGIQMIDLAQLSTEGALNIVGSAGKPLLRAEVKRIGDIRSLEISMPESNSIPQATVAPLGHGEAVFRRQLSAGRALEIRGKKGVFYGLLQMQCSGSCYVVKDGHTVLTLDGDPESLRLSLKSGTGMQLAAVKCSTELFDGADYVEVRVEPGVDSVLVIAVVLAVLLLSPYLPAADDDIVGF